MIDEYGTVIIFHSLSQTIEWIKRRSANGQGQFIQEDVEAMRRTLRRSPHLLAAAYKTEPFYLFHNLTSWIWMPHDAQMPRKPLPDAVLVLEKLGVADAGAKVRKIYRDIARPTAAALEAMTKLGIETYGEHPPTAGGDTK